MAYLKSGYKLMYENRDLSGATLVQHLKATQNALPAIEDKAVKYLNESKQEIDPKQFKLVFEKEGKFFGSTSGKVSEAIEFSVYSDAGQILLGREFE